MTDVLGGAPVRAPAGSSSSLSEQATPAAAAAALAVSILHSTADGVATFDRGGRYTSWNPAMERLSGRRRDEAVGRSPAELFPDYDRAALRSLMDRALAGETVRVDHAPFDAPHRAYEASYGPLLANAGSGGGGEVIGGVCTVRDVTDRRRAEQAEHHLHTQRAESAARESEARFHAIFDQATVGIAQVDLTGKFELINQRYADMLGYSFDELLSMRMQDISLPEELPANLKKFQRCVADGTPYVIEKQYRRKDGRMIWVSNSCSAIRGADGKVQHVCAVSLDVTARKRAEEELTRSRHELSDFVENATIGLHWVGPDGTIIWANQAELDLLGYEKGDYIGQPIRDFYTEPAAADGALERLKRGETLHNFEAALRCKDGSIKHVLIDADVLWEDGKFRHTRGFTRDLTRRKEAEDALQRSENRFRKLVEQSPLSTQIYAPDGTPLQSNAAWERLFGVTMDDIRGYNVLHDPELERLGVAEIIRRGFAGEVVNVPPIPYVPDRGAFKGQVRWAGCTIYPVKTPAGEVEEVVLVHEDITERKRAEEALVKNEQQLRVALETAKLGAWRLILAGNELQCTAQFKANFGLDPHQPVTYDDWIGNILPQDASPTREAMRRALESGEVYEAEYRVRWPDSSIHWIRASGRGVGGGSGGGAGGQTGGAPAEMIGVTLDITEQKLAEQELTFAMESAEAANRAKDQFLAVLSHELRTPLTPVLAIVSSLEQQADLPKDVRADLEVVRRNVELETRLIDDLLDLTRVTKGKLRLNLEPVDVRECINRVVEICRDEIEAKHILLLVDLPGRDCYARGDNARLQQVLWNLVKNAVKFTPDGGRITIRGASLPDDAVRVEVTDSGIGIDPALLPRLFNAFEQGSGTARQFGGLGLGLAISKHIADAHGGTLTANSAGRGKGATFTLTVPAARPPKSTDPVAPPAVADESPSRVRRILLVEDHADTARIMQRLLRGFNYDVEWAGSLSSALQLAEKDGPFDLVVSDLGLPDGSGLELMRQLRDRYSLTGIALSGYGMEEDVKKSRAAGFAEHLTKPVNLQALKSTIDSVIAR